MASHLWNVKKFNPSTLADAKHVLGFAKEKLIDFEELKCWVGYYLEAKRQKGGSSFSCGRFWQTAVKSKHRYRRGSNQLNYPFATDLLLSALAAEVDLAPTAPPYMIFDKLVEEGRI